MIENMFNVYSLHTLSTVELSLFMLALFSGLAILDIVFMDKMGEN